MNGNKEADQNKVLGTILPEESKTVMQNPPIGAEQYFGTEKWAKLFGFAKLLEAEGELRGLVGPREMQKLWDRHILNSTAIIPFIATNSTLGDIGSGAGFPGLVVAILRPDVKVFLIETMERRVTWLNYVKEKLELNNVTVLHGRSEEFIGKYSFDFVTARAVAALAKLLPWSLPLVKPDGCLVALKGGRAEEEIDAAHKLFPKYKVDWVDIHDVEIWGTNEGTRVVEIHKQGKSRQ